MKIETVADFLQALEDGPYTSMGSYPVFFLTADGGALSFASAWQQRDEVITAIRDDFGSGGWRVVAADVNWEDPDLIDDHSGNRIESAYAEDEERYPDAAMLTDPIPSGYSEWDRYADMDEDSDFSDFFDSYIETALWSSTDFDEDGNDLVPLDDKYGPEDFDERSLQRLKQEAYDFYTNHAQLFDGEFSQAGHDFWLTRNGHGAGFWDGDWPEKVGDELTKASKPYGSVDLYVAGDAVFAS